MKFSKALIVIACAILATVALGPSVGFSAGPCIPCEDMLTTDFGPEVTITKAELRTEITYIDMFGNEVRIPVPEHCNVQGMIWPAQVFNVKLPTPTDTEWNNRLYVVGNGVAAGQISEDFMVPGLEQGFATAGTDTGHQGDMLDWSFGYNPDGDPVVEEKLIDYCDESIHETTMVAKKIIDAYYCSEPIYSYFVGCSTGGRQGLIEAQRYPEDFDGILVGAPVHHLAEIQMRGIWEGWQLEDGGAVAAEKLPLLAAAVMDKCDSIDGLVDGVIDDPLRCTFDARTDLPACEDDVDGSDCFTTAQRNAIYALYDGPRNSAGELLTFGEAFGSETMLGPVSGWIPWLVWPGGPSHSLALFIGIGFLQFIGLDPPPGPGWDYTTFDFDTHWTNVMDNIAALCNATDPDLSTFKKLGGKIIHYDGWADQATGPYQTVDYYESVLDVMGEKSTHKFYKLYMIPGMFHCGGGLGCFDGAALFAALVDWVEEGVEPTSYMGVSLTGRTRPMCPYPQVARYLGEGSIDEAENFTCVELIPAKVCIIPGMLDLGTPGTFKALITLPKGYYHGRGWEMLAVVCEGASAKNVTKFKLRGRTFRKKGNAYIAEFNKEDLVNITPGEEVTFTVTAIFEHTSHKCHKSKRVAFEGSDEVVVIGE